MGEVNNIEHLAQVFSCKVGALLTTYLGLPLGGLNKDLKVWNPVIERVEERLVGWQEKSLSKEGRKYCTNHEHVVK